MLCRVGFVRLAANQLAVAAPRSPTVLVEAVTRPPGFTSSITVKLG